jgi:hypothetical protein
MKPDTKKRLVYSCAGGLVIPTGYGFLLYSLDRFFHTFISPALEWLTMPLGWPAFLHDLLAPQPDVYSDLEMPDMSRVGIDLFLVVVGNFFLYSLLTYLAMRRKQRMPRLR